MAQVRRVSIAQASLHFSVISVVILGDLIRVVDLELEALTKPFFHGRLEGLVLIVGVGSEVVDVLRPAVERLVAATAWVLTVAAGQVRLRRANALRCHRLERNTGRVEDKAVCSERDLVRVVGVAAAKGGVRSLVADVTDSDGVLMTEITLDLRIPGVDGREALRYGASIGTDAVREADVAVDDRTAEVRQWRVLAEDEHI